MRISARVVSLMYICFSPGAKHSPLGCSNSVSPTTSSGSPPPDGIMYTPWKDSSCSRWMPKPGIRPNAGSVK